MAGDKAPNRPAVALSDVVKSFSQGRRRIEALKGVTAMVRPGIVTGLIGPDAAGKTTLMRLVTGLLLPDAGSIEVMGLDVLRNPLGVQELVRYMPQRFGLYEDLTVQENLDLYADLQGVPVASRPDRYRELMKMTGLQPFMRRLAGDLSGGMKQKLGLACTLVRPPSLLVLDEPTVGVDPVSRRELWSIVYRLVEQDRMAVLLSTAYLDEAERCGDVLLMHRGEILGQGPPADFSRHMTGRSFLAAAPDINKRTLQESLGRVPGVLDATIQAAGIRLVTKEAAVPDLTGLLPEVAGLHVRPVPARFEDRFIALLGEEIERPVGMPGKQREVSGDAEEVIVVEGVERRFGNFTAVKDLSFTVRGGEVFGLLGANGAGKSTTFRMLCGLLPASEGTLLVAGQDLRHAASQARGRIGYMAQRFSLYAGLTVTENLRFFGSAYGLTGKQRRRRILEVLEEFGLQEYSDAASGELPLGYKQRLALAAALMHSPDILFLDEPTSGVDPIARREFWHRINTLAEQGVTVLVTTHFMEEAEYCDRLVIMAEGSILAQGTPEEMKVPFRTADNPFPAMEDVFIGLVEAHESKTGWAATGRGG
jgi:ABC-2 type transport system ATP-binding protein